MANEDDNVKSSSFAIFIWVSVSDFISHIPPEKHLNTDSTRK